jgi:nucleoside 2-deoxyribosyltransferase
MNISVYISGALIGSGDLALARSKYERCAAVLKDAGFSPYLPHQNTDPHLMVGTAPRDVFSTDVRALMSSDAVVAFLDEPSHGVGAEIAICIARNIPIVAMVRSTVRVSRFILGMIERSDASAIVTYEDEIKFTDVLPHKIRETIRLKEDNNEDGLAALLRQA